MRHSAAAPAIAVVAILLPLALGPARPASAREAAAAVPRGPEATPEGTDATELAALTGRQIYERVIENRFRSFIQDARLDSGDRGGRVQETRLRMHWKDFRDEDDGPSRGVLSKTLVKYTHPFDVRFSGYLVIHNEDRVNDQFVYFPARRKVVRVNLRGEAIFGTDFSFEDLIPRELQDATYDRKADEVYEGIPVFAVEAVPTDLAESEYSRFLLSIDRERSLPLRTRYWDRAGVEVKEMRVDPSSIERIDGIWVPKRITMHNLLLETYTKLIVEDLIPNPELPPTTFELRRLESH